MDIGKPLAEYSTVDIADLCKKLLIQPKAFWEVDSVSRGKLAGDRPGNAVFFYNDMPHFVTRSTLKEANTGYVNVLRYSNRPLYVEIQHLIETSIQLHFPHCDVMRVQLAELPPGTVITPHRDHYILAAVHRLHVPLVTHPDVKFVIDGQTFLLAEGMLYDLNNAVLHSVENRSNVMRVHLMVDMLPHSLARARYHDTEAAMDSAVRGALRFQQLRVAGL